MFYKFITIQINAKLLLTTEHRDEQNVARARTPEEGMFRALPRFAH